MTESENRDYNEFIKGIWRDNPVFVQVLGMCPMLAVTNSAINAIAMGGATLFVLVGSSFLVAAFKKWIPKQVRISCFIIIIATFVTIADYTLLALVPVVHKELGAFIPLIVANCMILGRQEAFASKNTVRLAVMDALGMSTGFVIALFGAAWEPWVIMILPPGGFLTLGLILLVFNWMTQRKQMFMEKVAEAQRSDS
jgi:electron transport complex protein RnfE